MAPPEQTWLIILPNAAKDQAHISHHDDAQIPTLTYSLCHPQPSASGICFLKWKVLSYFYHSHLKSSGVISLGRNAVFAQGHLVSFQDGEGFESGSHASLLVILATGPPL